MVHLPVLRARHHYMWGFRDVSSVYVGFSQDLSDILWLLWYDDDKDGAQVCSHFWYKLFGMIISINALNNKKNKEMINCIT